MLEIKNLTYTVTDEKTGKQIKILDDVSVTINSIFTISVYIVQNYVKKATKIVSSVAFYVIYPSICMPQVPQ